MLFIRLEDSLDGLHIWAGSWSLALDRILTHCCVYHDIMLIDASCMSSSVIVSRASYVYLLGIPVIRKLWITMAIQQYININGNPDNTIIINCNTDNKVTY
jgi:hypothetical protein